MVEPARNDGHARAAGYRGLVCCAVDPPCQTADNGHAGQREALGEATGDTQPVTGRTPGTDNRDCGDVDSVTSPALIKDQRRILDVAEQRRVPGRRESEHVDREPFAAANSRAQTVGVLIPDASKCSDPGVRKTAGPQRGSVLGQ